MYRDFPQESFSSLMLLPKSNACFLFSYSDKVYGRERVFEQVSRRSEKLILEVSTKNGKDVEQATGNTSASQREIKWSNMIYFGENLLSLSIMNFRLDHNSVISWNEVVKPIFAPLISQGCNIPMTGTVARYHYRSICYGLTPLVCHLACNSPLTRTNVPAL